MSAPRPKLFATISQIGQRCRFTEQLRSSLRHLQKGNLTMRWKLVVPSAMAVALIGTGVA
jgi:hypothetical protein